MVYREQNLDLNAIVVILHPSKLMSMIQQRKTTPVNDNPGSD